MTAPSIKEALEPCPFCGGEAERIDVPSVENDPDLGGDPNAGGSCIQCKRCVASTALHFDRKENLYSSWNDRFVAGVAEQSGAGAPETSVRCGAPAALATLQPSGERREAIARLVGKHLGPYLAVSPTARYEAIVREFIRELLASGLVQDEAGIRADERKRIAKSVECDCCDVCGESPGFPKCANEIAAAILAGRDGGE